MGLLDVLEKYVVTTVKVLLEPDFWYNIVSAVFVLFGLK